MGFGSDKIRHGIFDSLEELSLYFSRRENLRLVTGFGKSGDSAPHTVYHKLLNQGCTAKVLIFPILELDA